MPHLLYFVPTSGYDAAERERRLQVMRPLLAPGFTVDFLTLLGTPEFLDQASDFDAAKRAGLAAIGSISSEQCAAVIEGGALDPGLQELRAAARVPVIGPGEASLFVARLLGQRLSIITVDEHAVAATRTMVREVRERPEVVSIRSMNTPVRRIVSNLEAGRAALRREAEAAVREDGADVVYLGSMTLPTLGITAELRRQLGVPIIDPLAVALHTAQAVALAKATG